MEYLHLGSTLPAPNLTIWVKSANGKSHTERLSKLLTVTDTRTGVRADCQVVLSTLCPCNLLGRDLLNLLKLGIVPEEKGLTVVRMVFPHPCSLVAARGGWSQEDEFFCWFGVCGGWGAAGPLVCLLRHTPAELREGGHLWMYGM